MSNTTTNNKIEKDGNSMKKIINFTFGETEINVKNEVSFSHRLAFSRAVVENSYVDDCYSKLFANMAFDVLFMLNFSDYSFPDSVKDESGDKIDIEKAYEHIEKFNIKEKLLGSCMGKIIEQLQDEIDSRIEFENQKIIAMYSRNLSLEETLETLAEKGTQLLDDMANKLDSFTPETISESINDIIKNIPEQFLNVVGDTSIVAETKE